MKKTINTHAIDQVNQLIQLKKLFLLIDDLKDLPRNERRARVKKFMHGLGRLFLDYFNTHPQIAHTYIDFNQVILSKAIKFIQQDYVLDLEQFLQSTFEGYGEWKLVCEQRTNIEAFNVMFGSVIDILDTQEIDEYIQQRKAFEGVDRNEIPENIPISHWWWYV